MAGTELPPEPALDDTDAIALVVRMPDGSRHGRRFLMSDKLQVIFGNGSFSHFILSSSLPLTTTCLFVSLSMTLLIVVDGQNLEVTDW